MERLRGPAVLAKDGTVVPRVAAAGSTDHEQSAILQYRDEVGNDSCDHGRGEIREVQDVRGADEIERFARQVDRLRDVVLDGDEVRAIEQSLGHQRDALTSMTIAERSS